MPRCTIACRYAGRLPSRHGVRIPLTVAGSNGGATVLPAASVGPVRTIWSNALSSAVHCAVVHRPTPVLPQKCPFAWVPISWPSAIACRSTAVRAAARARASPQPMSEAPGLLYGGL